MESFLSNANGNEVNSTPHFQLRFGRQTRFPLQSFCGSADKKDFHFNRCRNASTIETLKLLLVFPSLIQTTHTIT